MRQTLLRIPMDADWWLGFGYVPGFGFGLVLLLWVLFGAIWLYRNHKALSIAPILTWLVVAVVIVKAPDLAQRKPRDIIESQSAMIGSEAHSPKLIESYLTRGQAYEQVYEYENAAKDYESGIEAAPEHDAGFLRLAWLYATCPEAEFRDGEKALEYAQTAFNYAAPANAIHWDTLAAAHAELGNFDEAMNAAQRAAMLADRSNDLAIRTRLPEIRARLETYETGRSFTEPRFAQTFPQSLPVRGYGFLMCLGFLVGGVTSILLARRVGIAPDVVWDLGIFALIGGIVGARMFYLVQYREHLFRDKSGIEVLLVPFQLQEGGLVLLGGLIFGSLVFLLYAWYRKLNPLLMADIALPGFFVALAFGRLGCLMNGCCYGDRCELPWAIEFPLGSVPDMALVFRGFVAPESLHSMPLHPTQIYSSLDALVLAFLTIIYFRYRSRNGEVLALGMLTYPITRFSIEYLRGDEMGQFGTGLTISQLVSLGLFVSGLVFAFWLKWRPRLSADGMPAPVRQTAGPAKRPKSSVGSV